MRTPAGQWLKILMGSLGAFCLTAAGVLMVAPKPWTQEDIILAVLFSAGNAALTLATGHVQRPADAWDGVMDRRQEPKP